MQLQLLKVGNAPMEWRVEAVDADGDGGVHVTTFSGPDAERRAHEYAAWKYPSAVAQAA